MVSPPGASLACGKVEGIPDGVVEVARRMSLASVN